MSAIRKAVDALDLLDAVFEAVDFVSVAPVLFSLVLLALVVVWLHKTIVTKVAG